MVVLAASELLASAIPKRLAPIIRVALQVTRFVTGQQLIAGGVQPVEVVRQAFGEAVEKGGHRVGKGVLAAVLHGVSP